MRLREESLRLRLDTSGFILGLSFAATSYLIPVFLQELGATYTDIGLIGGVRAAPYAFLPVLAGYLSDRYNRTSLYLLGSILAAVSSLGLAFSQDLIQATIANALLGLSMVFYWPVAESIIAEVLSEEIRVRAYARFSVAWSTAYFIGPIIGGFIAEFLGLRNLFLLGALIAFSSAPVILSIGSLKPERRGEPEGYARESLREILPLYGSVFIYTIALSTFLIMTPSYLSNIKWSESLIGLLFSAFGVSRTIAYVLMTKAENLNPTSIIIISSIMQSISMLLIVSGDPTLILLSAILHGATNGIYFTSSFDILSGIIPRGSRGLAIGLYETVLGVGFVAGPSTSGPLMDLIGVHTTFFFLAISALFIIPLGILLKSR